MVMSINPGEKIGDYTIDEKIEVDIFFIRYRALNDGSTGTYFELRQYKSPSKSLDWYPGFVEHQTRLQLKVSGNTELQSICEETVAVLTNTNNEHPELFKITPPASPCLAEFLDEYELASEDRLMLAKSIAKALSTIHKEGLVLSVLSRWSVGVRECGTPVFLDMDWVRFSGEKAPWDGHRGEVAVPEYAAPEVLRGGISTTETDVYALGKLIAELLSDDQLNSIDKTESPSTHGTSLSLINDLSDLDINEVTSVLRACLNEDPALRPTAEDVFRIISGQAGAEKDVRLVIPMVPNWFRQSLQTLAYWVAYQNEVYRHHKLPEGAIVAELTRLIDGNIDSDMMVLREPLYRSLVGNSEPDVFGAIRADLAVNKRSTSPSIPSFCEALIEVKRTTSGLRQIENDIARLARFRIENTKSRAFLVLVSQASAPGQWISPTGTAIPETQHLEVTLDEGEAISVRYRVRIVKKASGSFKSYQKATYCCLLEVL
jgi:Protein kinase domain